MIVTARPVVSGLGPSRAPGKHCRAGDEPEEPKKKSHAPYPTRETAASYRTRLRFCRCRIAKLDPVGSADRRSTVEDEASSRFEWIQDWQQVEMDRALNGKVIATISRPGVPIGVVKDRRAIMQYDVAREN